MSLLRSRLLDSRVALIAVLLARIGYGAALLLDPERVTKRWLGPLTAPTDVAVRGLGTREVMLHALALAQAVRGRPVGPFLVASMAGDITDIAATTAARRGLPRFSAPATFVVAGASAALSARLAAGGRGD
ncbi:MAG TPA: hypothetical protein VG388_15275 [Solirubrobacteraceae bacterium]|nr:hypothetical protein [Solirubrobacteraceae bacterium]